MKLLFTLVIALITTAMLYVFLANPNTEVLAKLDIKIAYYVFLTGFGICGWVPLIATIINKIHLIKTKYGS